MVKKTIEIDVVAPNAQQNINSVTTSLNNASKSSDNLNKTLSTDKGAGKFKGLKDSIGGLIPGFDKASAGASSFNKQLLILLANPIVLAIAAIVGAVTLLFKAFTSTKDGADKLSQVMSGLSAVVDVVRDRILNVGNTIVKFFSGDFKGALNEGKKAVSGFGDEVSSEFKKASEATKNLQEIEDSLNALSVSRAKVNRDLAISKELLTDENASYSQKKKALDLIKTTEGKQTEQELANAKKKVDAIKALNALSDTSREDKKKEQDAEAALFALQEQSARDRRAINKQEKTLRNQENSEKKEAINAQKTALKEAQDAEKALIDEKLKDTKLSFDKQRELVNNDNKLALKDKKEFLKKINEEESKSIEEHNKAIADLNKKYDDEKANRLADTAVKKEELEYSRQLKEIEAIAKTETEKNTLIEKLDAEHKVRMGIAAKTDSEKKAAEQKIIDDKKISDAKAVEDAKVAIQLQGLNALGDLVGLAKSLGEKNKGLQRAALIAESAIGISKIIINTQAANSAARLKYALLPGGAALAATESLLNKVSAGIGIAANVAATAKGLSALGGGGASSGGGSNPAGGGGASSTPQFNLVGQSSTNQLAQTISNQQKQPIKTYVVAGDVTTQQGLDRNAVQTSTFGG